MSAEGNAGRHVLAEEASLAQILQWLAEADDEPADLSQCDELPPEIEDDEPGVRSDELDSEITVHTVGDASADDFAAPAPVTGDQRTSIPSTIVSPAQQIGTEGRRSEPIKPRSWSVRHIHPAAVGVVAAAAVPIAAVAYFFIPSAPVQAQFTATINAPLLTVRAPAAGRVASITAVEGERVGPSTTLAVVANTAPPDDIAKGLKERLNAIDQRLNALDKQLASLPATDPAGPGFPSKEAAGLHQQRDAVADQEERFKETLARETAASNKSLVPITANIDGMVWSILVSQGAEIPPDLALAQIVDCNRMFLDVRADASALGLHSDEKVQVQLDGDHGVISGTVRARPANANGGSAAEEGRWVIAVDPTQLQTATRNFCPVGQRARITRMAPPDDPKS